LDGFAKTLMRRISFMNISMIDWIGYLAATLTTASFVPQAWLTFKTRDVSGISLVMYSAFTARIALLLAAGILGMRVWFGNRSTNSLIQLVFLRSC
jgi:MtN3 and saliva related transmembrane protein